MADVEQATKNPISRLQEICQQWKFPVPTYREAEGTMQEFGTEVVVRIQGEELRFHARGRTKKTSKAKVAQLVIDYITEHCPELLEPPALPVSPSYYTTKYLILWSSCLHCLATKQL